MSHRTVALGFVGIALVCASRGLAGEEVPKDTLPNAITIGAASTDKGEVIQIHVGEAILETPSLTIKRRGWTDIEFRPANGQLHWKNDRGAVVSRKTFGLILGPRTVSAIPQSRSIKAIREDFEKSN